LVYEKDQIMAISKVFRSLGKRRGGRRGKIKKIA